jgi:hypothetical protein
MKMCLPLNDEEKKGKKKKKKKKWKIVSLFSFKKMEIEMV